ncbi:MAG: VCBS repeat-containing protein [Planctomycetaceae bacterium]|nr:VCBS repeat-containing protein [Planctomycetaceae bacterium]
MWKSLWFNALSHHARHRRARQAREKASVCRYAEVLENRALLAQFIAVGTDVGVRNEVKIFTSSDLDNTYETETTNFLAYDFNPFGPIFTGGARVAFGDFNGDGNDELAVAAGPTGGPHVRIYEFSSGGVPGAIIDSFFAYGLGHSGGVFVAAGDIDGDGRDELITGADAGGGAHVRIFSDTDGDGKVSDDEVDAGFPFGTELSGGVRVAAGDVDNDGRDEVIVATGPGTLAQVVVYGDADNPGAPGYRQVFDDGTFTQFFPYGLFTGGVYPASGPLLGAGGNEAEIITTPGAGGTSHLKVFSANGSTFVEVPEVYPGFTEGVRVAFGDGSYVVDPDTTPQTQRSIIATVPGPGGGPNLKVFRDPSEGGLDLRAFDDRFVYPNTSTYSTGLFVAAGRVNTSEFSYLGNPITVFGNTQKVASIFVPPSAGTIRRQFSNPRWGGLEVFVALATSRNDAFGAFLRHVPTNRQMLLFNNVGGSGAGMAVRLGDRYGIDIGEESGRATLVGTYNPEGNDQLNIFDNLDASGEWQLFVFSTGSTNGQLLHWSLNFNHELDFPL